MHARKSNSENDRKGIEIKKKERKERKGEMGEKVDKEKEKKEYDQIGKERREG